MTTQADFRFYPDDSRCRKLAGGWLKLGIATLLIAGVYALLLVVARTPLVKDIVPNTDVFYTSLVIHVIFSNVFWFLAIAGVLWNMNTTNRFIPLGWTALIIASVGVGIIAISPFMGAGDPVMSNYIPFLNGPVFFAGLAISGSGFALLVLRALISVPKLHVNTPSGSMRFGIYTATNAATMAIMAFFWAFFTMPQIDSSGEAYYQGLFWLGGHVLQFTHALLMLAAWMWLATASGVKFKLSPRVTTLLFTLALFTVAFTPIAFLSMNVTSINFQKWFTTHMQIGGAAATLPLGLAVLWSLFGTAKATIDKQPLRIALWLSIMLFALGGVLGYMLRESSTLVTAHYHSVTGAVTLAFMALVYDILPHLGFGAIPPRLAKIQVYTYGIGQLLHVLGLAWAGGYGMARKVGGSAEVLDNIQQTMGMALMGMGGTIATIGGIVFLVIVIRSMRRPGPDYS
ncbi:MAG: hypothetical protein BMS9Abin18_0179 [Zetaproteobacteria bacterium]|nr:MAG: hypothetical protein BMS9Abin18_0179 [Zetaproteobacteria bacterium]